jgi:hypothetical protein
MRLNPVKRRGGPGSPSRDTLQKQLTYLFFCDSVLPGVVLVPVVPTGSNRARTPEAG